MKRTRTIVVIGLIVFLTPCVAAYVFCHAVRRSYTLRRAARLNRQSL